MLQTKPAVSIIIPVFNEEENLPLLYKQLSDVLEQLPFTSETVFIDDGSTDNSFEVLNSISDLDDSVKVIKLRRNFGQTAALVAGFDHATGDTLITMDADMQNDPRDIPALLSKLDEGYDIVSGWRKNRKDALLTKSLPSKVSNKLASALTGVNLHDFGCTLKAYRREVIEKINLYGELHRYIPAVASSIGVRVAEIEVAHHPRANGSSKYGVTRLARGFVDLITLKLLLTYMNRPMQMFGGLGILSVLLGMASAFATIGMKAFLGTNITGNPILYVSMMFFLAGFQFVSMGFLGEITTRTYHESQHKPIYVVSEVVESPDQELEKAS